MFWRDRERNGVHLHQLYPKKRAQSYSNFPLDTKTHISIQIIQILRSVWESRISRTSKDNLLADNIKDIYTWNAFSIINRFILKVNNLVLCLLRVLVSCTARWNEISLEGKWQANKKELEDPYKNHLPCIPSKSKVLPHHLSHSKL